jgi:sugar phosphate isomerase/epimerase
MQLGIFAKTFPGADPLTVLAKVKDAGFSCAQYNMACSGLAAMPDDISDDVVMNIAQASRDTGLVLSAISGTYNMIHPDKAVRNQGHVRLAALAAHCKKMGTNLITLCTGTRDPHDQWRDHVDNTSKEAWVDLTTSFEQAIMIADAHDVYLGVEPELANVVNSAAKAKRLITEMQSPRLKIIFDAANLFEKEDLADQRKIISHSCNQLAQHIIMAHAKDRAPNGEFASAGKGCLDYEHYLLTLKAASFDGPLITHGLAADEAAGVARFLMSSALEVGFKIT